MYKRLLLLVGPASHRSIPFQPSLATLAMTKTENAEERKVDAPIVYRLYVIVCMEFVILHGGVNFHGLIKYYIMF